MRPPPSPTLSRVENAHPGRLRARRTRAGRPHHRLLVDTVAAPSPGDAVEEPDVDDTPIDAAHVRGGGWGPSRYGSGGERGTLSEVTAEKTAAALSLLGGSAVRTYDLSERLFNGFPALPTPASPRIYERRLFVSGVDPGPGFDGILDTTTPRALNEFSSVEGRFPDGGTYQIGTQLDNLNHIAVGDYFYNGFVGADIAATSGTTKLGAEHIGPVITEESCSMSCPTNWRVRRAVTWSKLPMAVSHFARTTASRSRT